MKTTLTIKIASVQLPPNPLEPEQAGPKLEGMDMHVEVDMTGEELTAYAETVIAGFSSMLGKTPVA